MENEGPRLRPLGGTVERTGAGPRLVVIFTGDSSSLERSAHISFSRVEYRNGIIRTVLAKFRRNMAAVPVENEKSTAFKGFPGDLPDRVIRRIGSQRGRFEAGWRHPWANRRHERTQSAYQPPSMTNTTTLQLRHIALHEQWNMYRTVNSQSYLTYLGQLPPGTSYRHNSCPVLACHDPAPASRAHMRPRAYLSAAEGQLGRCQYIFIAVKARMCLAETSLMRYQAPFLGAAREGLGSALDKTHRSSAYKLRCSVPFVGTRSGSSLGNPVWNARDESAQLGSRRVALISRAKDVERQSALRTAVDGSSWTRSPEGAFEALIAFDLALSPERRGENLQSWRQSIPSKPWLHQEAEREEMRSQIRILQTAVSTPTPANEPVAPIEPMSDNTPQSIETSERIPSKRENFRPWFLEMKAKLAVDRQAFDNKEALFAYVTWPLLITNRAVSMVLAPDLFLDYLNRRYGDPNAKARALDRLRSLKQKPDESFASFFPKFEKELADSGGEWADVVQINYLEGAINNRLKSSLVSAVSREQRSRKEYGRLSEPLESRQSPVTRIANHMDWEPVKANRLINGRRARRKSNLFRWRSANVTSAGSLAILRPSVPGRSGGSRESRSVSKRRQEAREQSTKSPRRVLAGIPPMTIRKRVAPDENRRQERAKAEAEWATQKDEMDCEGLYVNFGINREYFTTAFVDCGCLCYGTISERLARKLHLPRIPIKPRALEQVNTFSPEAICAVTYFDFDIDGYQKKRAFFYVVRDQTDPVILGKKWLNQEDNLLHIGTHDHWVKGRDPKEEERCNIRGQAAFVFAGMVRRARKFKHRDDGVRIFAASLKDIEKALTPRKKSDPREKLPVTTTSTYPSSTATKRTNSHRIQLERGPDDKEKEPPWGPLYGMSREELILLDKGFIRASSSPASAPVLFVRKPGGGLRFCVDYRGLNAITKKDRYPLPLIEETLRSLSKAKWLTKLDVIAAFHKIRVEEGDEWKTAFRTRYGLYEWLVTPFGLTGAPATFQRYINHTLRDFLDEFCSAYIDDILIYSSGSLADHRNKVRQVLARLRDAGLQIDIDKCDFEAKSVKYLGFIVEAGKGIRVDPEKVQAIQQWQRPRSVKGVRSFLGFANYYRQFIPRFSNIAAPLTALTKKDAVFAWSKECDKAFEELKALLTSAPVLAQWDPDRETIVETDSSGYVTGGALSQKGDDGIMRPVAFFSKKNAPAECNYPIHDKELLAIIRRLEHWDAELRSVKSFTVLTDHLNLRYFTKKQQLSERQARWAETLSRYSFTIKHRPGKEAVVPDTLSRREQDMPHSAEDDRLQGRRVQLLQRNKGGLVTKVKSGYVTKGDTDQPDDATTDQDDSIENPFSDPELQKLWDEGVKKHNRYWLIRKAVQQGERPALLARANLGAEPRTLRTRLMQETHDSTLAGHPGRDMLKSFNIWREKRRGLLKPLPIPDRIWSELSIDFSNGSTNLMVVTDRLSKSVVLESLKDITAETTARALLRNVVQHHGVPRAIVTDRGTQFTSRLWQRLCELLRVKQRLSTAWHPETDGATERANQEVERYLRIFAAYAQDNWEELLPAAMMAINNHNSTSTGLSPFFITHGYHVDLIQVKEKLRTDGSIVQRFREATEWAQAAIASAQEQQEKNANSRRQPSDQFKPGDKVWLRLRNIRSNRPSKKLDWLSAKYTVLRPLGHTRRLDTPPGIHNVFHVSLLRLAADDPLPSQTSDDYRPPAILTDDGELWKWKRFWTGRKSERVESPTWEPVKYVADTIALASWIETTPIETIETGRGGVIGLGSALDKTHRSSAYKLTVTSTLIFCL
ncbi:reverse transcriptase (RNA-dependent DNA polymerase) [Hirsutella rhossiliensis]